MPTMKALAPLTVLDQRKNDPMLRLLLGCPIPLDYLSEYLPAERVVLGLGIDAGSVKTVRSFVPVPNSHEQPEDYFRVTREALDGLGIRPRQITVVLHSHPPHLPGPSRDDLIGLPRWMIGGVVADGDIYWYKHKDPAPALRVIQS